ncbi:MAG: hypothetical protein LBF97_03390 [Elusimicrobiota bacterium]|jgi:hypothetical protein|nr:hypothetical protein [Elusimicrobiota bacterium]
MVIENKLKKYILKKYGSILSFSNHTKIPDSTFRGIFKRGIRNSVVSNISKICKNLDISIDLLLVGQIGKLSLTQIDLRDDEKIILQNYNNLNEKGQEKANELILLLLESRNYQKIFTKQPNLANHTKWQNH